MDTGLVCTYFPTCLLAQAVVLSGCFLQLKQIPILSN
jgi:hypothetical protein